jgi:CMP-N,N'-diacetyllegionaminic acid synthase
VTTVAIIPARGGSKGLPGKNLRLLGGTPLIAHTIAAARRARRLDRVVVSTDDRRIANAARRAGAEVPFLRPAELATDISPTVDAVRHAVDWLERDGQRYEIVVTLQPTSPLRGPTEVDDVLALLDDPGVRSAATVTPLDAASSVLGTVHDGRFRRLAKASGDDRRQASAAIMRLTGSVYATRRDLLDENRLLDDAPAVLVTHGAAAIDVDDREGLLAARRALRGRR